MCDHPILLEPDGNQLTIIGIELGGDVERSLGNNGCAFIRIYHQAAGGLRHLGYGEDTLVAELGVEQALYEAIIQQLRPFVNLQLKQYPLEQSLIGKDV